MTYSYNVIIITEQFLVCSNHLSNFDGIHASVLGDTHTCMHAHTHTNTLNLGHTNLILCFSDLAGLFLADFKKKKKKIF